MKFMRDMDTIKGDFKDQGVEFLAVNVFEDADAGRSYAESSGYDFNWVHADEDAVKRLGIQGIPALIVVDQNGSVVWRSGLFTPFLGGSDLRRTLDDLTSG